MQSAGRALAIGFETAKIALCKHRFISMIQTACILRLSQDWKQMMEECPDVCSLLAMSHSQSIRGLQPIQQTKITSSCGKPQYLVLRNHVGRVCHRVFRSIDQKAEFSPCSSNFLNHTPSSHLTLILLWKCSTPIVSRHKLLRILIWSIW